MGQFKPTTEGYSLAKKWLYEHKLLHCFTNGFSVDGWSVVECANYEYKKYEEENNEKIK